MPGLVSSSAAGSIRVAVLITCHNRRSATVACIRTIKIECPDNVVLDIYLTDDGSSDGSAEAVLAEFPETTVIRADGSLFWCRGMERAWRAALLYRYDGYLWVNDDILLREGALTELFTIAQAASPGARVPEILVGSMADPTTGITTYGGQRRTSPWHPGRLQMVEPDQRALRAIDTFNGNLVYVPADVVKKIGIIDPTYSHATGDTDYGLRARKESLPIFLLPGHSGHCQRNPHVEHDFITIFGRKGLPWRDWLRFTRRHSRHGTWPIAFAGPYMRSLWVSAAKAWPVSFRRRRRRQ